MRQYFGRDTQLNPLETVQTGNQLRLLKQVATSYNWLISSSHMSSGEAC